jgi:hypothetical protein
MDLTTHTQNALTVSEGFNLAMSHAPGITGFQVTMTAPEGESGSGVRSVQHLKVEMPKLGVSLVIGQVDHSAKTAELYGFKVLREKYERRFRAPLPLGGVKLDWLHLMVKPRLEKVGIAVKLPLSAAFELQAGKPVEAAMPMPRLRFVAMLLVAVAAALVS